MTEQQRTTRDTRVARPARQGVAEDQALYRAGTEGARVPRRAAAGGAGELRELVQRRAAALVELEKH